MSNFIPVHVDSQTLEDGDLHLKTTVGLSGLDAEISHQIISMKEDAIEKWLREQGWASPDEKHEMIKVLKVIAVWAANPIEGISGYEDIESLALRAIKENEGKDNE